MSFSYFFLVVSYAGIIKGISANSFTIRINNPIGVLKIRFLFKDCFPNTFKTLTNLCYATIGTRWMPKVTIVRVPFYIYLSIRHRSLFMPFYASLYLKHGGLIGESKWDLLQHLNPDDSSTLKTFRVSQDLDFMEARNLLEEQNINLRLLIKPQS